MHDVAVCVCSVWQWNKRSEQCVVRRLLAWDLNKLCGLRLIQHPPAHVAVPLLVFIVHLCRTRHRDAPCVRKWCARSVQHLRNWRSKFREHRHVGKSGGHVGKVGDTWEKWVTQDTVSTPMGTSGNPLQPTSTGPNRMPTTTELITHLVR